MRKTFLYQINVTRACNLRCSHCYIDSTVKDQSGKMTSEDFLKVIQDIILHMKAISYDYAEIHVIGGEPTMMGWEWMADVIPRAKSLLADGGIEGQMILVSNLLSREIVQIGKLFDRVNTSWEPITRFPKVKLEDWWKDSLKELQESGIDVGVTTAITKQVVDMGAKTVLDKLYQDGIRQIHLGFFIPSGDGKENASTHLPRFHETSQFLIQAADWYMERRDGSLFVNPLESMLASLHRNEPLDDIVCPILSGSLDINWNGDSATCLEAGGAWDVEWQGNVLKTSIQSVTESPSFKKAVMKARHASRECLSCEEYPVCQSACGVLAKWKTSDDHDCHGFKSFIKHMRGLYQSGVRPLYDDCHNSSPH